MSLEGDATQQLQQMQAMLMAQMSASGDGSLPTMPGMDPNMIQAYHTMFQYLQQNLHTGAMGLPPMPFPGMTPPYTPSMPAEPTVAVSVDGMKFQYQLTEDDLHKVFSRYGGVRQIRVNEAGASAQITFHSFNDAQTAMSDLNGKVLNGLEGTLRIHWVNQGQNSLASFPSVPFPGMPFPSSYPASPGWPPAVPGSTPMAADAFGALNGSDKGANQKGVRKYTCRFIIGIENDAEFQVARRIIGAKGANMKRIVKNTEAKLRLRGTGSGYFEGAGQKESSEPLQLCISCIDSEHYKAAVGQARELLERTYEEYRQFCADRGLPAPSLEIQFSENQLVYSALRAANGASPIGDDDEPGDISGTAKKGAARTRRARPKGSVPNPSLGDEERGEPGPNAPPVEEIEKMIDMRNEARRACNFTEADRIREALHANGVALMDEPGGRGRGVEVTTWRYWRD